MPDPTSSTRFVSILPKKAQITLYKSGPDTVLPKKARIIIIVQKRPGYDLDGLVMFSVERIWFRSKQVCKESSGPVLAECNRLATSFPALRLGFAFFIQTAEDHNLLCSTSPGSNLVLCNTSPGSNLVLCKTSPGSNLVLCNTSPGSNLVLCNTS